MFSVVKSAPQVSLVLASLVLWVSFAWGLPAGTEVTRGDAEVAAADPWAGVKISDAYDYAKCPRCGKKNELRAERCSRCGYEFPQPSSQFTYPPWVFVPGKGYYEKGALLEPGKSNKSSLTAGSIIIGFCLTADVVAVSLSGLWGVGGAVVFFGGLAIIIFGLPLLIYGLATRKAPVYAFAGDELSEPFGRPALACGSPDSGGRALKVEVTALGF